MKPLGLLVAVALVAGAAPVAHAEERELVGFEGTLGASTSTANGDDYASRLHQFGFEHESTTVGRYALAIDLHLLEHLAVGATFFNLDAEEYVRDNQGIEQEFSWSSHALGGFVQGDLSIEERRAVVFFTRLGGGVAYGTSVLDEIVVDGDFTDSDGSSDSYTERTREAEESFSSPYFEFSLGAQIMPTELVGFLMEIRYVFAPALENLTGDTHDVGGVAAMFGLRVRSWR